ncbi:MAG: hypothetical protein MUC63_05265 [Planctomycetes bacterium]|jgi:hypothetical protein|nr:hypothetical protein [Planctomycetota bacterium]
MNARPLAAVLWAAALAAPAVAGEAPGPAEVYANRLEEIRGCLREACAKAGLPFERLGYGPRDVASMRDGFRLNQFDAWISDPLFFKVNCDSTGAALRNTAQDPAEAFDVLCRANDVVISAPSPAPPAPPDPAAFLLEGARAVFEAAGEILDAEREAAWKAAAAGLPPALQAETGRFLLAVARAARAFRAAFAAAGEARAAEWLRRGETDWFDDAKGEFRQPLFEFCRALDMTAVLFAARQVARASVPLCRAFRDALAAGDAAPVKPFAADTPLGRVAVAGPGKDEHPAGRYLLLVDLGGDDVYGAGAGGAAWGQFASLCVDLGGNDRYAAEKGAPPSFGAAWGGVGLLFDVAGDDVYEASGDALGACAYGAGILWDASGADRYAIRGGGQGCASFGVAALLDVAGNDRYACFHYAQGAGLVRGVGALADLAGDDEYVARDDELANPSPQSPKHNTSMAQGAGCGRRADFGDGHSASGGIGLLVDAAGNDRYSAGVMAQAHGYWYGTGILIDYAGDDEYRAAWYGQSTAAHWGLSYLRDAGGSDRYFTEISQNLGNGRDLSLSWFEDDEGADRYDVVDRGAGCGNITGIGIFLDLAGDDAYSVGSAVSMGFGNLEVNSSFVRREIPTVGIFVDARGKDTYSFTKPEFAREGVKNGASWTQTNTRFEFSAGIDRE